jgi:hypothetical protein
MFTVIWKHIALDSLADVYVALDPATRGRVSGAVNEFNLRLVDHPMLVGESRDENQRVAFVDLLFVRFSVDESRQTVRVHELKRAKR